MANTKITELTAVTALAGTDVFPVVDVSASTTNKVSVSDLLRNAPDGTADAPSIANAGDQDTGIFFPAANSVGVSTAGTQKLVIDSFGDVGIGAASPGLRLHVQDGALASAPTPSANCDVVIEDSTNTGIQFLSSTQAELRFGDAGNTGAGNIIYNHSSNYLSISTNENERLRIDSSGVIKHTGSTGSDETNKLARYVVPSHDTNEEDVLVFQVENESSFNQISFGGGTSSYNAATQIVFRTASAVDTTTGSERMRINSSGNVGIGTTSPSTKFVVSNGGAEGVEFSHASGTNEINSYNRSSSARAPVDIIGQTFKVLTGNPSLSTGLFQNSSGNVGIGTSSPVGKTYISGPNVSTFGVAADAALNLAAANGAFLNRVVNLNFACVDSATNAVAAIGLKYTSQAGFGKGDLIFGTRDVTTDTAPTERMRIDSSGRLLVGATSAAIGSKMDVHAGSDGANIFGVTGADQSSEFLALGVTSSEAVLTAGNASSNGTSLVLRTANSSGAESERMRIDSSGRLLVGTSSGSGEPIAAFQGRSNDASDSGIVAITRTGTNPSGSIGELRFATGSDFNKYYGMIICASDGSTTSTSLPGVLRFSTTASGNTAPTERFRIDSNGQALFYSTGNPITSGTSQSAGTTHEVFTGVHSRSSTTSGGTVCIHIFSNGNIQNTNNSYGQISDVKLKENIVNANSQWDDIKDIQVRNFNFKEETGNPTHTQIGVVAQELETVSPGLVYEMPDTDDEGNNLGTVTKSVNYSVLYMKAVKALQEAMDRIETLETKVAALEAQ